MNEPESAKAVVAAGRFLFVVFIYKPSRRALILSARDMTQGERRLYQKD